MIKGLKIEDMEICEGEKPRQATKNDLELLEKMKLEWMQKQLAGNE